MRVLRTIVSTAVMLLVSVVALAQLSDQQVISEVQRLQAMGASQQQILMELAAKGVTREQAERLQSQYKGYGTESDKSYMDTESRNRSVFSERSGLFGPVQDSTLWLRRDTLPPKPQIFGRNLFSTKDLSFEPSMNLPTPENYQLGAGDEIIIDI